MTTLEENTTRNLPKQTVAAKTTRSRKKSRKETTTQKGQKHGPNSE